MSTVTLRIEDISAQDLSHELNISLTGIKGGAELLNMSNLSNEQLEELKVIQEAGQRLEKIINKILSGTVEEVSTSINEKLPMLTKFFRLTH